MRVLLIALPTLKVNTVDKEDYLSSQSELCTISILVAAQ